MITVEYSESFAYAPADVFAALADLLARPSWQPSLIEVRVEPAGPARLGSRVFETRKYPGRQSANILTVSEFEPDRLLTLETAADVRESIRERYRIEPLADGHCRLECRVELGGIPRMLEFIVRQATAKELPQNCARLASVLASRAPQEV
ncbi:MAG TPA: SRPBCC family protein [Roseiflexaceae bacterium]|nr:SRPBCC family protein [Roseiflexaceae bacterium]